MHPISQCSVYVYAWKCVSMCICVRKRKTQRRNVPPNTIKQPISINKYKISKLISQCRETQDHKLTSTRLYIYIYSKFRLLLRFFSNYHFSILYGFWNSLIRQYRQLDPSISIWETLQNCHLSATDCSCFTHVKIKIYNVCVISSLLYSYIAGDITQTLYILISVCLLNP